MPTMAERLDASLRDITQPLIAELRGIELEIATREAELKELREGRTKLVTIVRQIDPELAPKKVTGPKVPPTISEDMVGSVYEWLKENVNGDEFYASGIMSSGESPTSGSQLSKALRLLHERGQIRLTRSGSGGSKHYRLVA